MNADLLRELKGNVPLMSQSALTFLDDVESVLENKTLNDDAIYSAENEEEILEIIVKISAIEENLKTIIGKLKTSRNARHKFLINYPKWKKVREDGISKLREIALSIQTDRFNCNISKLVGYTTSLLGGVATLASAILIPFTFGLTTPLAVAGAATTAAGASTAFGTSITEAVRLKTKINQAQEIIEEDKHYFQEINSWLDHATKLVEALSEVLEIDIVKYIVEAVKDLVNRGTKMQRGDTRLNFIKKALNGIIHLLPADVAHVIPMTDVATVISVLVTLFLLLLNTENGLVFDCASLTIRSIAGIASLADGAFDIARYMNVFTSNAVMAKDLAKAATRGAVAVLGIALDIAGITLTSIDIHKGSLSPEAEKITKVAGELEEEANILQNIYENIIKFT